MPASKAPGHSQLCLQHITQRCIQVQLRPSTDLEPTIAQTHCITHGSQGEPECGPAWPPAILCLMRGKAPRSTASDTCIYYWLDSTCLPRYCLLTCGTFLWPTSSTFRVSPCSLCSGNWHVTPMTVSWLLQQVRHSGVVGSRRRERRDVFEGENPSLEFVRSTLHIDPSLLDLDRHGLRGTWYCVVDIF
jgi:hypothetical protein